ncbi:MAG TPA: DUF427 domain-containing protein [Thermoleophilia bacterium]|nr:DUF427 domain-containing protein [Thermoleophilia bacterium]
MDYPRPPRVEQTERRVRVEHAGLTVADSARALRVLETTHPPVYYLPPDDVRREYLRPSRRRTFCEFKGQAAYYDLVVGDQVVENAAWHYPAPLPGYEAIRDHVAFYPDRLDACFVDDERVTPEAGHFYGGWITEDIEVPRAAAPRRRDR